MTYVLLIFLVSGNGVTSTAVDGFSSYDKCVHAANQVQRALLGGSLRVTTACITKE